MMKALRAYVFSNKGASCARRERERERERERVRVREREWEWEWEREREWEREGGREREREEKQILKKKKENTSNVALQRKHFKKKEAHQQNISPFHDSVVLQVNGPVSLLICFMVSLKSEKKKRDEKINKETTLTDAWRKRKTDIWRYVTTAT